MLVEKMDGKILKEEIQKVYLNNEMSTSEKIQSLVNILEMLNSIIIKIEKINKNITDEKKQNILDQKYYIRIYITSKIEELNQVLYIDGTMPNIISKVNKKYIPNEKPRSIAFKTLLASHMVYMDNLYTNTSENLHGEILLNTIERFKEKQYPILENALYHIFRKTNKEDVKAILNGKTFPEEIQIVGDSPLKRSEIKQKIQVKNEPKPNWIVAGDKIALRVVNRRLKQLIDDDYTSDDIQQALYDAQSEVDIYSHNAPSNESNKYNAAFIIIETLLEGLGTKSYDASKNDIDDLLTSNEAPLRMLITNKSDQDSTFTYEVVDTHTLIIGYQNNYDDIHVYASESVVETINDIRLMFISMLTVMEMEPVDSTYVPLAIEGFSPRTKFITDEAYYSQFIDYKNNDLASDLSALTSMLGLSNQQLNTPITIVSSVDVIMPFYNKEAIKNILNDYVETKGTDIAYAYAKVNEVFPDANDTTKSLLALIVSTFMSSPVTEAVGLALKPALLLMQTHLGASGQLVIGKTDANQYVVIGTLGFEHKILYLNHAEQNLVSSLTTMQPGLMNWQEVEPQILNPLLEKMGYSTDQWFNQKGREQEDILLRNRSFTNFTWDLVQETTLLKMNLIAQAFKMVGSENSEFKTHYPSLDHLLKEQFEASLIDKTTELKEVYFIKNPLDKWLNNKVPFFEIARKMVNDADYIFNIADAESIILDVIAILSDFIAVFGPLAKVLNVAVSKLAVNTMTKNIRLLRISKQVFLKAVVQDMSQELMLRSQRVPANLMANVRNRIQRMRAYRFIQESNDQLDNIQRVGLSGGAGGARVNRAYGPASKNIEFDTAILHGDPIGQRYEANSLIPLPAQPEAFHSIVAEKISILRCADDPIVITGWRSLKTGRIHILDGQHRFIAAAKLGIPVEIKLKKYGTAPTNVGWDGTHYISGTPAKHKLKGVLVKPIFKKPAVRSKGAGNQNKIENLHLHNDEYLGSIGRPNKNYSTGAQLVEFVNNLKSNNVVALISLDNGMPAGQIVALSNQLSSKGIEYVSNRTTYIKDFFSYKNMTQPKIDNIDNIVNRILSVTDRATGNVLVHCALGDGRSGMIKAAVLMKKSWRQGKLDVSALSADISIKPSVLKESEVLSYPVVKDSIDVIRQIHPKAVERADDIQVLNEYAEYLSSFSSRT